MARKRTFSYLKRLVGATFLLAIPLTGVPAAELTEQELRGKEIYLEGESESGDRIFALVGRSRVKVPGAVMPCGNCHGNDGLGRPEGGVDPPDITWTSLTREYGHRHPSGRAHPPFDEGTIANALRAGVDPAFNDLDVTMPLYEMSDGDMAALIAYMRKLEGDLGPGVSEEAIRIGTLLPRSGALKGFGDAIGAALEAYFADLNARGGIYGRKLELVVADRVDDTAKTRENLLRLIREEPVFALLGDFAPGMETMVFTLLEEEGLPNIGPLTLFPVPAGVADSRAFLTVAGIAEQARVLAKHLAGKAAFPPGPLALVHSGVANVEEVVDALGATAAREAFAGPPALSLAGGGDAPVRAVAELAKAGVKYIVFVGIDEDLRAFAAAAAEASWHPAILVSGPLNARAALDLPKVFDGKVFAAYPTLPADASQAGRAEMKRLREA